VYGAAQALCAGTPLLSSNAASLPEVVGDAAPLLPPGDVAAWSEGFRALLGDRDAAEARAAAARPAAIARFAWAASARAAAAAYRRVAAEAQ
jgi:glycosyltransferase involved in cell wall biosynthesis